ncbi:MAG: thermonuclease family protein [Thermoplasmata archaeon]
MKRKMGIGIIFLLLLLSGALSGCFDLTEQMEPDEVSVVRVIDGDTFEARWSNGTSENVRILGLDTPETKAQEDLEEWNGIDNGTWLKHWGYKATNFTEAWIGNKVTLEYDENEGKRGYYGRVLAYVELSNGTDLGGELLKRGLARAYTEGDCSRESKYVDYQEQAMEDEVGIWSIN